MLYIMYQKGTILEFIGSVVYAYDIFVIGIWKFVYTNE